MISSETSSNMSNMQEILKLAKILRKDGDQVLNGSTKLSLSTKLLHNLNDAFTLIIDESKDLESSFQVCNNSETELFRDLKFLHDFVQKTIWLKIVHMSNDSQISIDITKFRHLRYLELQKICIDLVCGIQGVRGQLETISCTGAGGVGTIGRLLAACGGDDGVGFVWASLKRLALPYNGLGRLDKSLELAPWLQTLDLSHNFISIATGLDYLPSLKYVNLGYNKLEFVPSFNKLAYRSLQVLVLKNNYIESINGLQGLDSLAELDLSFNCLTTHSLLWPIEVMTALLWLNLEGNPLSYHKRHRVLTSKYLHSSLAENKFILDHHPLSKSEKLIVAENRLFAIRSSTFSKDNASSLGDSVISNITTELMMNSQEGSVRLEQQIDKTNKLDSSISKTRRKTNVREVNIADDIDRNADGKIAVTDKLTNSYLEMSLDHLETKKKILALREKFGGDNWLSSQGGSFVQDIMGLERTSNPAIVTTSAADMFSPNRIDSLGKLLSTTNDSCHESFSEVFSPTKNDSQIENQSEKLTEYNNDLQTGDDMIEKKQIVDSSDYYDLGLNEGDLFLVKKMREGVHDEMEELFLIITLENILERDPISEKIKYRWSMDTVLSCLMGRGESVTIDFIFDTTRRDRQNRTYYVESVNDAIKVVKIVEKSIKTRPLLLKVFKCMKCSTHFSLDCDYLLTIPNTTSTNTKQPMCPSCKSTLVIQSDELLTPDNNDDKSVEKINNVEKNDSIKDRDAIVNLRHSTSQSSIGTATSLDDSRESTPSTGTVTKKYESDIEILSNPSQSSIEVLDDGSKSSSTPNRKRSSEERRIAIAPNLLTIPDTTLAMAGLTESSSSGSLTDSICTTYESKKVKTPEHVAESEKPEIVKGIKDPIYAPVANLTSMLGGLLQTMKIGNHKESPIQLEKESDVLHNDIQYSYTNFTSVDHRIKLHLILNVFELENEELVLFLRADILMQNQPMPFPGCLVLSTSKIYVLRVIGTEGENPQRWLHKEISWTIDLLRTFAPLPFKQGVLVELKQPIKFSEESANFVFICILQDFQRTSNLLFYLTDLVLPASCEVAFSIPDQCTTSIHNLMMSSRHYRDSDAVRIFAVFSSASLQLEMNVVKIEIGGLLVTTSSLVLIDDKMHWLHSQTNETPSKFTEQPISNLIEVFHDGFLLSLNFFDEIAGIEQLWTLTFVSSGAAEAVINAIQPPWEELFSVPLQIINKISIQQKNEQKS
ncbi:hypothetical protein PV328_011126 [Microctonus aethiopoides]|uniref:Serine/threonine-protein kinase 11-interacting protein n=2 Tax=Microctonus aethiopoides TaxID=144406 RepID=A0AA39F002_9HYME|nr:hypothetical protein PV328_011126 [Microctonus aethiopoides]